MSAKCFAEECINPNHCDWAEFPIGSVVTVHQGDYYLIGWTEGSDLIISPYWIWPQYSLAMLHRRLCHTAHVRDGSVTVRRLDRFSQGRREISLRLN